MQTKLTLRLDDELIRRAKERAKATGRSVSQMVADYFALLEADFQTSDEILPPGVRALKGIMAGSDLDEDDYKAHLEAKHQ
mgnify:CR=1 FL=1